MSKALNTSLIKAPLAAVAMGLCALEPPTVLHLSAMRDTNREEVPPHPGGHLSPASHLDGSVCKVSLTESIQYLQCLWNSGFGVLQLRVHSLAQCISFLHSFKSGMSLLLGLAWLLMQISKADGLGDV